MGPRAHTGYVGTRAHAITNTCGSQRNAVPLSPFQNEAITVLRLIDRPKHNVAVNIPGIIKWAHEISNTFATEYTHVAVQLLNLSLIFYSNEAIAVHILIRICSARTQPHCTILL